MVKKKQTQEEKAMELTSAGIFRKFEGVVPKGATTQHVLEAAMMLIGRSLAQMDATPRQRRDVLQEICDYMLCRVSGFKDEGQEAAVKEN